MKREKNSGRPAKAANQKRKYQTNVRLNTEEHFALVGQAKSANLKPPDYIRACIVNSRVEQRMDSDRSAQIRTLSCMANNLNQIAKRANQAGYEVVDSYCMQLVDQMFNIIKEIRDDG